MNGKVLSTMESEGFAYLNILDERWTTFINTQAHANIFHHPAWASMIAECYGYKPLVSVKLDELGRVDAGMPFMDIHSWLTGHRWVSLPFSDHCEPLFRNHVDLEALVEHLLVQYNRKAIPKFEIRASIPVRGVIHPDNSFVFHKIKLTSDHRALLKTFDKSRVREPIRQSMKRNVEVRLGASKADMHIFYDLLVSTRRRLGAPVQPKRYFDLLWQQLIEKNLGFLLLAYKGSKPIAGAVFLYYKEVLTAKYNASLMEYWNLKANNSLYWSAIKWGCENGFKTFDFGRTENNNQNLRDFKNGWGTTEEPLTYSIIVNHQPKSTSLQLKRIIYFLITNSPSLVCRLIGESLYKHFA